LEYKSSETGQKKEVLQVLSKDWETKELFQPFICSGKGSLLTTFFPGGTIFSAAMFGHLSLLTCRSFALAELSLSCQRNINYYY